MKIKTITIQYTNGKTEVVESKDNGLIITPNQFRFFDDKIALRDVFIMVYGVLNTTLPLWIKHTGSSDYVIDPLDAVIRDLKMNIAPNKTAKNEATKTALEILWQEVRSDKKHKELFDQVNKVIKQVTAVTLGKHKDETVTKKDIKNKIEEIKKTNKKCS